MKRTILIFLVVVVIFSLGACAPDPNKERKIFVDLVVISKPVDAGMGVAVIVMIFKNTETLVAPTVTEKRKDYIMCYAYPIEKIKVTTENVRGRKAEIRYKFISVAKIPFIQVLDFKIIPSK